MPGWHSVTFSKLPEFNHGMPESSGIFRGIQFKVIIGFSLVLIAAVLAAIINFTALNRMSEAVSELSRPDPKLDCMRELMAFMTNEDVAARSYSLTGDAQYFRLFHELNDSVHLRLAELKLLIRDKAGQYAIADSVTRLTAEREAVLDAFIDKRKEAFARKTAPATINAKSSDKRMSSPSEEKEDMDIAPATEPSAASDTVADKKPGNGFFSFNWAKNIFKSGGKKSKKAVDTLVPPARAPLSVTPRPSLTEAGAEEEKQLSVAIGFGADTVNWSVEELVLLQRNKEVMDRIRSLLIGIEESERMVRAHHAAVAREKAANANRIISAITLLGLVAALVFIGLILRDIAVSNRLRAQLVGERLRAEKLARAKQEFLASMSHEIRTPLNSIIGFTDLLSKEDAGSKGNEYVSAIRRSSDHLLSLVNEILDFSKLEDGKFKVQESPFNLVELMEEIRNTFQHKAAEKGLEFHVQPDPRIPVMLSGDAMSLKQVLINLVNNAIKFTERGSVTVTAQLEEELRNSCRIRFEVKDTGIGIAADIREHLFTPFTQSRDQGARMHAGTGLGLAISKKLAAMMGGTIAAASEEGRGSVFSVVIPFAKAKRTEEEKADSAGLPPEAIPDLQGRKVLVVDDEPMNVKLCEAILTTYGLTVTAAANGREAVNKIQHNDFDLVLMDLQMPEMDGIEAVKQIRAMSDEVKRALPVISLSANVFGSTAGKYADAGFTDELIKPFREEELIRVIEKYVNGSPRTASSPKEEQPELSPYNLKYLESTSGSDARFIRGMLESFVTKSEEQLSKMQDAMRQGDMKALQELAHKMIPSCRYLGMSAVEEKMRTLESLTAGGTESSAVATLLKEINDELLAVIPMLKSEIDKHSQ
jgi:hypothetical protein